MVYITQFGSPVNLSDPEFTHCETDIQGVLVSFEYKGILYRFYNEFYARKSLYRPTGYDPIYGYYEVDQYLKYIQYNEVKLIGESPLVTPHELSTKYEFDFSPFYAVAGDSVSILRIEYLFPYTDYFHQSRFSFSIKEKYEGVFPNYIKNNGEIDLPADARGGPDNSHLNNTQTGYFYTKNLGRHIVDWTISNEEKKKFAEITTKVCIRIGMLEKLINSLVVVDPLLQQAFKALKETWGQYFNPAFPADTDFDPVLPANPVWEDFVAYHNKLVNLYLNIYRLQDILNDKKEEQLLYLLNVLPIDSFSLFPPIVKQSLLDNLIQKEIAEEDEETILKIVVSVSPPEADAFLDYLLQMPDGRTTNFMILYEQIDDSRTYRYPFMSYFAQPEPNRKHFVYAVYDLWKVSKYNFYHIPPNVTPTDQNVNPNAFFVNEGLKYYAGEKEGEDTVNYVLSFAASPTYHTHGLLSSSKTFFATSVKGQLIEVKKGEETTASGAIGSSQGYGGFSTSIRQADEYFGTFHLYQPISLVGYQPDLELNLPETSFMPVFLFHYAEEFDRIKDFDAACSLGIELALEAGLFFFTGGLSSFRHFRHFGQVNKLIKAMKGGMKAEQRILVWRGLEVGSETISLTSSVLMSTTDYLGKTTNDPDEQEFLNRVSSFFMVLALTSGGSSAYARSKAVKSATEVLTQIEVLTRKGIRHNLDTEVLDLLHLLKNSKNTLLTLFRNKISGFFPAPTTNHVLVKFDALSPANKDLFWRDFGTIEKTEFWQQMNKQNGQAMDNWLNLNNAGLPERNAFAILISKDLTNLLIRVSGKQKLMQQYRKLTPVEQYKFLQDFKAASDKDILELENYDYGVELWQKHTPSAQTDIGGNVSIWLKYFAARDLLKQKKFREVAELFNLTLTMAEEHLGVRFVTDGWFDPNDLTKAIEIANRTDDVRIISTKLGIPEKIMERVKKHYYIDEHLMKMNGELQIGRFERDIGDNTEWLTMIEKPIEEIPAVEIVRFKRLIAHEYIEAKLMDKGMSFRSLINMSNQNSYELGAHLLSPKTNNSLYESMGRVLDPPIPDLENFSNLDEIVDWYVDFYKL